MSTEPASVSAAVWAHAPAALTRHAVSGATMGTRYAAVFHARSVSTEAVETALQAAVDAVDRQMSTWKPDSDLCRFNRAPTGEWIDLPSELLSVMEAAFEVERQSGGAFDAGVGAIVDAWGFGPNVDAGDPAALAGAGKRARAAAAVDLDIAAGRARKRAPLALDLCGIAKGFGVDRMARCLEQFGIDSYLVSIDGEVRAGAPKPDGLPWSVAVETPDRAARHVAAVLEVSGGAVATSGDYRHWREVDGRIVSHTIDPRTDRPVAGRVASVTVLGPDCMRADAWATALMVLGEHDGPVMAAARGIDALFMVRAGAGHEQVGTGIFG